MPKDPSPGPPPTKGDRLVVVGASAGGIEALSVVVSSLPATFPAPIIVAQHLHPDHPSSLVEIIARRTELRVVAIEDRTPLEPGTIYIVRPDRHVSVTDHEVRLEAADGSRPKPSVDRLFETAADVFGERLIAVILSGTGSDGAAGAQHVSAAGGSVIAQDPETASFPSMPRSLSPSTVDAVTRLEAIGPLLEDLVSGGTSIKSDDESLDRFLDQLRDRTGIDFGQYKRPTIVRRIERRMAATRTRTLADYRRYILRRPDEVHRLTSSLLIKVTDFFRDPALYGLLREDILPRLIKEAESRRELRIWSAGCATGQEAYSLAILVADALGPELPTWNIRIFATDADPEAIAFARRGVYPAAAVEAVSADLRKRFFRDSDGEFEVAPEIRAITVFGEHDLGARAPFPRIDLVLCRNVLIYFTPELQRRALHLFAFSLRDGGFLVLGKSESTNPMPSAFVIEHPQLRVSRRAGARVTIPTARAHDAAGREARLPREPLRRALTPERPIPPRGGTTATTPTERAESILLRLPVGVCVLDQSYDIQFLNPAARSLLGIHGAAIGQDFVHHARSLDGRRLRAVIDLGLTGESVQETFEVTSEALVGAPQTLAVTISPMAWGDAKEPTVLVTIEDVSREREVARSSAADLDRNSSELVRLRDQLERLTSTNSDLLSGNDELVQINVEMRTANEELQVYNEELQAASEEVETLNEELQATNEELDTLNEELQATVEELNTANDDIAARADYRSPTRPGAPSLTVVPDLIEGRPVERPRSRKRPAPSEEDGPG